MDRVWKSPWVSGQKQSGTGATTKSGFPVLEYHFVGSDVVEYHFACGMGWYDDGASWRGGF